MSLEYYQNKRILFQWVHRPGQSGDGTHIFTITQPLTKDAGTQTPHGFMVKQPISFTLFPLSNVLCNHNRHTQPEVAPPPASLARFNKWPHIMENVFLTAHNHTLLKTISSHPDVRVKATGEALTWNCISGETGGLLGVKRSPYRWRSLHAHKRTRTPSII